MHRFTPSKVEVCLPVVQLWLLFVGTRQSARSQVRSSTCKTNALEISPNQAKVSTCGQLTPTALEGGSCWYNGANIMKRFSATLLLSLSLSLSRIGRGICAR